MGINARANVQGANNAPQPPSPILRFHDVRLRFGGLTAVDSVEFNLHEGEMVALVGPNGAGKTSLLNCVSGYHHFAGDIVFRETSLRGKRTYEVAQLGVGRTFQHAELISQLSVVENILLGRHVHTRANWFSAAVFWGAAHREQIEHLRVVEEIVEFLELERYRARPAGALPHGVQRLVGLARALAMEPTLLLLDEPSSGMSRSEREDFARFLIRLRRERPMSILWVEHDMQLVRDLADRVVVMNHGKKIADDTPDRALDNPEVRTAYLGVHAQ